MLSHLKIRFSLKFSKDPGCLKEDRRGQTDTEEQLKKSDEAAQRKRKEIFPVCGRKREEPGGGRRG